MVPFKSPPGDKTDSGFIIVAVLWILGALATVVVIYSLYARDTELEFVNYDEKLQARALAVSGVELAAYQLMAHSSIHPVAGQLSFRQGTAVIDVEFRSENSRIDLNFAPKEMLAGLFVGLGVKDDDALDFADRIVAWRTPLPAGTSDTEAARYQAAGKSFGPRHGPFQHVYELGMVADLPPALIDRILPYVTVYSGRAAVNLRSASSQVLAAVPGLSPEDLQYLLGVRENSPEDIVRVRLGNAASYITLEASRANRVTIDVRFPSSDRFRSQAIIFMLEQAAEPYYVLSWHDDIFD